MLGNLLGNDGLEAQQLNGDQRRHSNQSHNTETIPQHCLTALQGEAAVLRDAFGVVAVVAMTPLITIQLLGFKAIVTEKIAERRAMKRILDADDQQIINFM